MRRLARWVAAGCYGAALALIIAYGLTYLLTKFGLGMIPAPEGSPTRGPEVLARAGLNLYASQHALLFGAGELAGPTGGREAVEAYVVLPLTVWAIIPAIALVVGGYAAGRARARASSLGRAAASLLAGLLYAAVLALLAGAATAKVSPDVMPSYEGASFNPPDILFRPDRTSAFGVGLGFGLVFACLGAVMAGRRPPDSRPGSWWACVKGAVVPALLIQLMLGGAAVMWFANRPAKSDAAASASSRVYEMLPTFSGMSYALLHGAAFEGNATSGGPTPNAAYGEWSADVSLTGGVVTTEDGRKERSPLPTPFLAILVLPAIGALATGALAVRWGSRGGALLTALRVTVIQVAYLAASMALSQIAWGGRGEIGEIVSVFKASISTVYTSTMAAAAAGFFVLACMGALIPRRRRMAGSIFAPQV